MPRLPDLFPEAGPARRGMRGWRIPLGRGRVCAGRRPCKNADAPRSFPALLRCRRCRQRRAGATRFSPGPALFRRREACSSVLRRLCPREVSRPKGPFFLRSCPGVPTSAQGDVFLPRRGARATGKLHARRSCNGFTQGAACPSFPAEDFRAGGPRTRRGRAGRPRSSAQVVRGRFVTDGQPRLRRGTGRSALKLPGDCSALP